MRIRYLYQIHTRTIIKDIQWYIDSNEKFFVKNFLEDLDNNLFVVSDNREDIIKIISPSK